MWKLAKSPFFRKTINGLYCGKAAPGTTPSEMFLPGLEAAIDAVARLSVVRRHNRPTDRPDIVRVAAQMGRNACFDRRLSPVQVVSAIAVHLQQPIWQEMATPTRFGW
jgi:hypothetical protein